ncbi:MAG: type II secretion system secretin GspD [Alphaproteobacteria bacterium]|nr:type II secretion system secretin GspD [Alphaproteobacteria bacterium]
MRWRRDLPPRAAITALLAIVVLGSCKQPETGLVPLEQPTALQAAAPRISGPIPTNRSEERPFEDRRTPVMAGVRGTAAPPPPGAVTSQGGDVTLNFVDTDIREIARAVLGTTLKVDYTIDPAVHGTGSIETPAPLPRSALLGTLETLLNENGAALVVRNGIYNVVPLPAGALSNLATGANGIGAGAEVVPLRYASAKDLAKMLEPYVGQAGKITAGPAGNALLVTGDPTVRQTLIGLIHAFDIDILAGRSYALFPVGDGDPAKIAGELEKVLQAQGEGGALSGIVQVLPMERVNAVLVVSAQPRYLDAAERFFHLSQRVEEATARTWHVYYVQNGSSADLELLLQRAFTPNNVSPTPPPPGTTAPGAAPQALAGFGGVAGGGAAGTTPGATGATGGLGGGTTGLTGGAGGAAGGGLGAALAAGAPPAAAGTPATEPLSAETGTAGAANLNRMRIIANRTNNALLIYATPAEYSVIEGMLRKIDVIPLQVLIEATIAEVDLNDQLQYGTQFFFKTDHVAETLGPSSINSNLPSIPGISGLTFPSTSPYFILSKGPQFALSALAEVTKVKILSAPEIMVLDNQPARLQVGQQVPVLTGQATSTLAAGAPTVNSVEYHETGVIMQVTPRVNTGGLVSLDLAQEVSDVAAAATNTVQGSPTFNDQVFRTRVAVQDGQTVGMAGLIRDNASQGNTGLPFLKDIPVLGTLFSTQGNSRMRAELLVLITPHVVHDQRDARALTEDMRSQLINAGLVPQQVQHTPTTGSANPNGL